MAVKINQKIINDSSLLDEEALRKMRIAIQDEVDKAKIENAKNTPNPYQPYLTAAQGGSDPVGEGRGGEITQTPSLSDIFNVNNGKGFNHGIGVVAATPFWGVSDAAYKLATEGSATGTQTGNKGTNTTGTQTDNKDTNGSGTGSEDEKEEGGSSTPTGVDTGSSSSADDALKYIASMIDQLKSGRSSYSDKLNTLVDEYVNRERFSYDPSADALYQNYLAAMQNAGQLAMKDTMGQAAALTGGYGSTYATQAAQGAYNNYIQQANQALPDYYNIAANAYDRQGEDMYSRIKLLQNQEDEEYNKWLDQMKLASGSTGSATGSATGAFDNMTSTQENTVMSNALNAYKENGGDMSAIDTMLDGMTGYNFSKEFRDQVKNFILSHTSKITKIKDKTLGSDKYTDGKREFTYSELMKEYGTKFTEEQKQKIKDLSEGRSYVF